MVLTPLVALSGTSKFDLSLFALETAGGLELTLEYSTDLFEAATVDRMLGHYGILLEEIVLHPDQPIGALPMLTEEERRQMLAGWSASAVVNLVSEWNGAIGEDLDFLSNELA
jgi:non-ribosomal peptide synthetase component F